MSHDQGNRSGADHAATPEDHSPETESSAKGRRQFIKKAIVTAPVILTVASRPVWARNCTLSGILSGNLSDEGPPCEACTPGFWMKAAWPKYSRTEEFNSVFGTSHWFFTQDNCTTLDEVIHIHKKPPTHDGQLENFGFQAVGALLNAAAASMGMLNFGYTEGQIIAMVHDALSTGNYTAVQGDLADINTMGHCPFPHWVEF